MVYDRRKAINDLRDEGDNLMTDSHIAENLGMKTEAADFQALAAEKYRQAEVLEALEN